MSAPAKLKSLSNGQRPLFYPGQVLSDAAVSRISTFTRLGLAAASQRLGWGIIYGLFPSAATNSDGVITSPGAETNPDSVTISRGMVADQDGRLFVLDHSPTTKLTDLLSTADQAAAAASKELSKFDLWLSIGLEAVGPELPFRSIGVDEGFAPAVTPATSDNKRLSRQSLVAHLELRAVSELEKYRQDESEIVSKFKADFNKDATNWNAETPYQETLDKIHVCRAEALAKLYDRDRVKYDGIPLGSVTVKETADGLRVVKVGCGVARREQPPLLPSTPDHINSAALFDLEGGEAVSWLARNGIPTWTVQSLAEESVRQQMHNNQKFRCWDVELQAGTTAKLYTNGGRIALVKQGPTIKAEFDYLLGRIASLKNKLMLLWSAVAVLLIMFMIVGAIAFVYYHWK